MILYNYGYLKNEKTKKKKKMKTKTATSKTTLDKLTDWAFTRQRFHEKTENLMRIGAWLKEEADPQNSFKTIHVTGTNGKGSTCHFLQEILIAAGYKTAMLTSPHLIQFNERFKINKKEISNEELQHYLEYIQKRYDCKNITFPELCTLLAFLYFKDQQVDIAIIEVGLGGLHDPTNIIMPEASIITHIALDHTHILGATKQDIAQKKAGIIKEERPLISAEKDPQIQAIFEQHCKEKKTQAHFVTNKDCKYDVADLGQHQYSNAACAIKTLQILNDKKTLNIPQQAYESIINTQIAGRLQTLSENPQILIDGAHNTDGLLALSSELQQTATKEQQTILVLGSSYNDDKKEGLLALLQQADIVVLTQASFKGTDPIELKKILEEQTQENQQQQILIKTKPHEALEYATSIAKKSDRIIITGSLYLLGEILKKTQAA